MSILPTKIIKQSKANPNRTTTKHYFCEKCPIMDINKVKWLIVAIKTKRGFGKSFNKYLFKMLSVFGLNMFRYRSHNTLNNITGDLEIKEQQRK